MWLEDWVGHTGHGHGVMAKRRRYFDSLNDDECMPIGPTTDVERHALLKHGAPAPFSRGNWSKLRKQMDAPLNGCQWQHNASPYAAVVGAPLDPIHTVIPIRSSWERREELDEYEVLGYF